MDAPDVAQGEAIRPADTLILVPVTDAVLLPGMVMPLAIGRLPLQPRCRKPPVPSSLS